MIPSGRCEWDGGESGALNSHLLRSVRDGKFFLLAAFLSGTCPNKSLIAQDIAAAINNGVS